MLLHGTTNRKLLVTKHSETIDSESKDKKKVPMKEKCPFRNFLISPFAIFNIFFPVMPFDRPLCCQYLWPIYRNHFSTINDHNTFPNQTHNPPLLSKATRLFIKPHPILFCWIIFNKTLRISINFVDWEAKGLNYKSVVHTVRTFCLSADDALLYSSFGAANIKSSDVILLGFFFFCVFTSTSKQCHDILERMMKLTYREK